MKEIIIHARAGQGAITLATILGNAAFLEGKYALAFPHFGAARMGAPMNSFVRISEKEIRIRSQVYTPDYVLVVDPTLMRGYDVFQGIKPGGRVFINQGEKENLPRVGGVEVFSVPADEIAIKIFGRPRGNTALLGAFSALTGEVTLDSLVRAVGDKFSGEVARLNQEAIREGYQRFSAS